MAWVPVGKVWAKVYSPGLLTIIFFSDAPSLTPASASLLDSVIPCPLWFRVIRLAISFFGPPIPRCTPYTSPYSTCAASSSPFTSLSRTAAHEASFDGTILMPYFLSKPMTEAITTDAQSVSGIKPTLTSVFSGASEPAAHTWLAGITLFIPTAPPTTAALFRNSRRDKPAFAPVLFINALLETEG